jgi:glycerate-2-kinase
MTIKQIKNKLINIYNSAIEKASPCIAVRENIKFSGNSLEIKGETFKFKKIFIAGFGKASCAMAQGILDVIPKEIIEGAVITKYGHSLPLAKIEIIEAGHPVPDENSIKGAEKIITYLTKASYDDLVIFLISGGGSAIIEKPREGISLSDIKVMTEVLLRTEAKIQEINIIRKHLSEIKGGGLARLAYPANFISLIISDVIGSDISAIASGPTCGDPSTFKDCLDIIEKYDLSDKIPVSIKNLILKGIYGEIADTPFPDDLLFKRNMNYILLDNKKFCHILNDEAKKEGFKTVYIKTPFTTGTGEDFIKGLRALIKSYSGEKLLILGGEVTFKIPRASGKGGRNQHLSLLYTRDILPYYPDTCAMFASTDGTDGPTEGSGGFSHRGLLKKDIKELTEAIDNYDSYNFLKNHDELFTTGPTGNNLNDVFLIYTL